jgi:adrenodoxin-NADP+ reductase
LITKCFAEQSGSQEQQFARKLHLRFLWTPIAFQGYNDNTKVDNRHENRLCSTLFRRNRLTGSSGRQKPVLLEESAGNVYWNQSCELAFRSIGYKGKPFELVPFDERTGVVPNKCGRVLSRVEQTSEEEELFEKGLYVVGWLKRGPTGIVGSNKWDAEETVNVVAEDILSLAKTDTHNFSVREDLQDVLRTRNIAFVNFEGWKRIDEEERRRGQRKGIEREKMLTWEELLDFGVVGAVYKSQGDESELVTKK